MSTTNTLLRQCSDTFEAEIIRDRLAAADIRAFVTGTDMATALSLGGAGTDRGVRIEVAVEDHQRAVETLLEDERQRREAGDWICGRCEEVNESSFELCWSCEKPRSADDARTSKYDHEPLSGSERFGDLQNQSPTTGIGKEDGNPYRPPTISESDGEMKRPDSTQSGSVNTRDELDEQVRRTLVASIAATMLFPPISTIYMIWRLIRLPTSAYQDPNRRKRIRLAKLITVWGAVIGFANIAVYFLI